MKRRSSGLLIALSAGGKNAELAAQGLGIEHVEELMVRLAMKLLRAGHRLAFGGTLGNPDQPLTKFLIDAAQSWLDEDAAKRSNVTQPATWPLVNYSAWPYHTEISEEQRAQLVGICRVVNLDPPGVAQTELAALVAKYDHKLVANLKAEPQARRYTADALSAMRAQSAQEAELRIVWGGRIAGAGGWLAGILEEVALSLVHNKPVLVLGGFGGCAKLLADFLANPKAAWPDQLTPAACADAGRDALLTEAERKGLSERFARVTSLLAEYRAKLHSARTIHGISSARLRDALREETARRVIGLVATVARQCLASRD